MNQEENNALTEALENTLSTVQDDFVRESLMSDSFLDFVEQNTKPIDQMFAYYRCAILEVETKFNVLEIGRAHV